MQRLWALLGSLVFFVVAPGTILGLVPWWITSWQMKPAFLGNESTRFAGVGMIILGLVPLLSSFLRFAWDGLGTPAPIAPPKHLVVTGFYRRVRNPIYIALVIVLLGEALFFADGRVAEWAVVFWLGVFAAVLVYEEPTLREWFGEEYRTYCENVPRWIPRLTVYTRHRAANG
jgi:protein-S-isoprenylcysteine O-methyltransferase Ste14